MAYSATSLAFVDPESPDPVLPPTFSNMEIEGYPAKMIQCVMGATSRDVIHWTKTKRPLLLGNQDMKFPPDPAPERIGDFHRPCLLWDDVAQRWLLYFDYRNMKLGMGSIVGLAENKGDFMTDRFEYLHFSSYLQQFLLDKKENQNNDLSKLDLFPLALIYQKSVNLLQYARLKYAI